MDRLTVFDVIFLLVVLVVVCESVPTGVQWLAVLYIYLFINVKSGHVLCSNVK